MTVIHLTQRVNSDTLHVPELRPLIGKQIEITIREVALPSTPLSDRWKALEAAGGQNLVDPQLFQDYRDFDMRERRTATP